MSYPGGKGAAGVAQIIINQQPPHSHYVEPFLGSGAVMRAKRPAFWNTGIDLDAHAVTWFAEWALDRNVSCNIDDGVQWLHDAALRPDALVYCDPPYLMETRRKQRALYHCEFDEDDHWRLLRVLRGLKCMVQLSGYWSSLYAKRLEGWRCIRFQSMTRAGQREECLWMNYPEPAVLHDYRFLGRNFRERERIHRKTRRWIARLNSLPALERLAIYSEMASTIAARGDGGRPRADIADSDDGARGIARSDDSGRRPTALLAMQDPGDRTTTETAVLQ
jgi:DNA adenine methylase